MKKIWMLIMLAAVFAACNDKEEMGDSTGNLSDSDKAGLYDKTWYPTASTGGVNYTFNSNGEFIENKSLIGSWSWANNSDTMNITSWDNQRFKMVFDEIGSNQIKWRSNLNGDNFRTQFVYRDTE
jgi:hypothetical protein